MITAIIAVTVFIMVFINMCKTFSPQYTRYIRSPEWIAKSKSFKAMTGDRCVLLPWLKANHAHHLHYQNLESEEFVRDCVPLNSKCHSFVHWIYDRKIPWLRKLLDFYLRAIARLLAIYVKFEGKQQSQKAAMTRLSKPKLQAKTTRLSRQPKPEERAIAKGLPRALPLSREIKLTISELDLSKRRSKQI